MAACHGINIWLLIACVSENHYDFGHVPAWNYYLAADCLCRHNYAALPGDHGVELGVGREVPTSVAEMYKPICDYCKV